MTAIFFATQTFPPRVGGMENVMYALATGLAARNHEVHVQGDRAFDGAAENFSFSYNGGFKTFRAWRKRRFLKRILRPQTGPLVICDSWKSVSAVPDMTRSGGRLAVLAHGQEYLKTGRRAERIARALTRTDIFIANSEDTLARASRFLPEGPISRYVIPPTYALPPDAPPITAPENSGHVPLKLFSLCRLEPRKGLAQTIMALAKMKTALPDFNWQIAGAGPETENLRTIITTHGLEAQVFLTGQVDQETKTRLLSEADLFIMPSYLLGNSLEGFGISYIEAARFGVPALAGNSGGAREAVLNGETGWCVDTLNARELGAALYEAMTDPHRRQRLGRQAQARYLAQFSGPSMLDRFVEACDLNS